MEQSESIKNTLCPACKKIKPLPGKWCGLCGYVDGELILVMRRNTPVKLIESWIFVDINGNRHDVPAIQIGKKTFHFGKDGAVVDWQICSHLVRCISKRCEPELSKAMDLLQSHRPHKLQVLEGDR